MILSNVEIQKAIDNGRLIINPEPFPRQPSLENPDCPYNTTSVDLRLGEYISIPIKNLPYSFDLQNPNLAHFLTKNFEQKIIDSIGGFTLQPHQFALSKTLEKIELPLTDKKPILAARIEGRSSYARCGLIIHFTAPTIHAGFKGNLTLELINLGANPIVLRPKMAICQLIIETVEGEPIEIRSKFYGQETPEGLAK